MANINAAVTELNPIGGATNAGYKIGLLGSTVRAAQNDTITITNASEVVIALLRDTDDTLETMTYDTNEITMTRNDTTNVTGIVIYR
tara:strand:+ start:57 stop:317 length:261 start_codon:yes stop_codon:yes gene_type:complete